MVSLFSLGSPIPPRSLTCRRTLRRPPRLPPVGYLNMRWSTLVFSVTLFYSLSFVYAIPHDVDEKRHWLHKRQGLSSSQSSSVSRPSPSEVSQSQSSSVVSSTSPPTTPRTSSSSSSSSTPTPSSPTLQPSSESSSTVSSSSTSVSSSSSSSYVFPPYNPIFKLSGHPGPPAAPRLGLPRPRPLPLPTLQTPKVPHPTAALLPLVNSPVIPSLLGEVFRPTADQEARRFF